MRIAFTTALVVTILGLATPAAVADDGQFTVSVGPYKATEQRDGTASLEVDVVNLGSEELELVITGSACEAQGTPSLPGYTSATVEFVLPSTCELETPLNAAIVNKDGSGTEFQLTVEREDEAASPNWTALLWFLAAAAGSLLLMGIRYLTWTPDKALKRCSDSADEQGDSADEQGDSADEQGTWARLGGRLPGIADDWSFADSWVSNLGLAAALFTGVFGATDVLAEIFGEDAVAQKSLAVVSAAIAAGLVGSGPLFLTLFQCPDKVHTVKGVLVGSSVAVAGNAGLILTLAFGLGGGTAAIVGGLAVVAFLFYYAFATIGRTLDGGSTPPAKTESEVMKAAALVAQAIRQGGTLPGPAGSDEAFYSEFEESYPSLAEEYPYLTTSPGDEPRRRSAAMP